MNFFERDLLVSRILSGKLYLSYNKSIYITQPSIDTQYKANILFNEALLEGKKSGLLSKDDCEIFAVNKNILTEEEYNAIPKISKDIENLQIELYSNRNNHKNRDSIKTYINNIRNKQNELINLSSKFYSYSYEGYASFVKIEYLVRNITYYKGKKFKFNTIKIEDIMNFYSQNIIYPSSIRYIARTSPWLNKWQAFKANGVIFPNGYKMTDAQQLLLMWSKFYDNVAESSEPPEQEVIDDDDMMDGWLLLQNKKNKKENANINTQNSKIQNAQEVYLVANNIEEAKKINEMNSLYAKKIKNQRLEKIRTDGIVHEQNMPDIKNDLMIQANRAERDLHVKRR